MSSNILQFPGYAALELPDFRFPGESKEVQEAAHHLVSDCLQAMTDLYMSNRSRINGKTREQLKVMVSTLQVLNQVLLEDATVIPGGDPHAG